MWQTNMRDWEAEHRQIPSWTASSITPIPYLRQIIIWENCTIPKGQKL